MTIDDLLHLGGLLAIAYVCGTAGAWAGLRVTEWYVTRGQEKKEQE